MTRQSRNGSSRSDFGTWLRQEPRLDSVLHSLSILDVDWCIHRFAMGPEGRKAQNFMFIEEKRFAEAVRPHQADTLASVYQFFNKFFARPHSRHVHSKIANGSVRMRFWGIHKLVFSHSGPLDSEWIEWDNKRIDVQQLVEIIRFVRSPFTLHPRDERLHHGGGKQLELPIGSFATG